MTETVKPEVGQEAWIKERYYSRTTIYKGKIVKVTATLQVVVEYETGKDSPDSPGKVVRQMRFKPSRWRDAGWDHMGGSGGYSQTYYSLHTGPGLTDAVKLELRREAAKSRSSRKVRAAKEAIEKMSLDDRYSQIGIDKLKAALTTAEEFVAVLKAAIELQELPEPPAETENDE